jgi:transcriptional regulator with XRE-family HTH domain
MPIPLATTFNAIAGQVIAYHRKQYGWNQTEFGVRVMLAESQVSRTENGNVQITAEFLDRAGKVFSRKGSKLLRDAEKVMDWLERRGVEVTYSVNKTMSKDELMKQVVLALKPGRRAHARR